MHIEITVNVPADAWSEEIREALTAEAIKAYHREARSRRMVSVWRWNQDSYAADGSHSVWRGSLVGRSDRSGGHPVLAEVTAYVTN